MKNARFIKLARPPEYYVAGTLTVQHCMSDSFMNGWTHMTIGNSSIMDGDSKVGSIGASPGCSAVLIHCGDETYAISALDLFKFVSSGVAALSVATKDAAIAAATAKGDAA